MFAGSGSDELEGIATQLYGGNVLGDNERFTVFVNRLYFGAYGSEPDYQELSAAVASLNAASEEGRDAVINAARGLAQSVFDSSKYAERGRSVDEKVIDLFDGLLGRAVDPYDPNDGNYWRLMVLQHGVSYTCNQLTNAAEFTAYAGTLYRNVNWLIPDQLGTPRIVLNNSGSLAATKRHDYLPFGEEMPAGVRSSVGGYATGDNVRQKFTSKERETETNLDYFIARYYSAGQGRFTTADIVAGNLVNPQTFNLYAYVTNNPLKYVDPTGHQKKKPGPKHRHDYIDKDGNYVTVTNTDQKGDEPVRETPPTIADFPIFDPYRLCLGRCSAGSSSRRGLAALVPMVFPRRFTEAIKGLAPRKVGRTLGGQALLAYGSNVTGVTGNLFAIHDMVSGSDILGESHGGGTHMGNPEYGGFMATAGIGDGYLISNAQDDEVDGDAQAIIAGAGLFGVEIDFSRGKDNRVVYSISVSGGKSVGFGFMRMPVHPNTTGDVKRIFVPK